MREILEQFKIEIIPNSIKRVQMSDDVYFGPDYKDYVSNSKLGLLNPEQGGSPQKFLEGFKSSGSTDFFALGSAVHQLTLEKNDYELSNIVKLSGKLGQFANLLIDSLEKENKLDYVLKECEKSNDLFDNFLNLVINDKSIEKLVTLAIIDADYYTDSIVNYKGVGLPARLIDALSKTFNYLITDKPEYSETNKKYIYLQSDLYNKCVSCTNSLNNNKSIQDLLNNGDSYAEDVILADAKITFPVNFNDFFSDSVETIVKLKIKIDNWTIDHEKKHFVLNDLKTTGKPIQYFMGHNEIELGFMGSQKEIFVAGSWQKFHYHRQMAMYLFLLKEYIKQEYGEGYSCTANMLVVETCGSNISQVYPVSNNEIISGFDEFKKLLKRVAYHQVYGYENVLELINC